MFSQDPSSVVTILEISSYALDSCTYIVMHVLEWFNQGLNTVVCIYIAVLCMLVFLCLLIFKPGVYLVS